MDHDRLDTDKIDEAALAIWSLTHDDTGRFWKGLSWTISDRLHEKGWILDPKNKSKSAVLTEEGAEAAEAFLEKHFARPDSG